MSVKSNWGRGTALAFGIVLAGVGFVQVARANFPPSILTPLPPGTGGEKEVDPPVVVPPVQPPVDPPTRQTPEPGTMALAVIGAATLAAVQRRRKNQ